MSPWQGGGCGPTPIGLQGLWVSNAFARFSGWAFAAATDLTLPCLGVDV